MKYLYKVDSFIDFEGKERKFVLLCVTINDPSLILNAHFTEAERYLNLGVALCNEVDEFDEQLGVKIALGRAQKKLNHMIVFQRGSMINNDLVNTILERESAYLKKDPGFYIEGYDVAKDRYLRNNSTAANTDTKA